MYSPKPEKIFFHTDYNFVKFLNFICRKTLSVSPWEKWERRKEVRKFGIATKRFVFGIGEGTNTYEYDAASAFLLKHCEEKLKERLGYHYMEKLGEHKAKNVKFEILEKLMIRGGICSAKDLKVSIYPRGMYRCLDQLKRLGLISKSKSLYKITEQGRRIIESIRALYLGMYQKRILINQIYYKRRRRTFFEQETVDLDNERTDFQNVVEVADKMFSKEDVKNYAVGLCVKSKGRILLTFPSTLKSQLTFPVRGGLKTNIDIIVNVDFKSRINEVYLPLTLEKRLTTNLSGESYELCGFVLSSTSNKIADATKVLVNFNTNTKRSRAVGYLNNVYQTLKKENKAVIPPAVKVQQYSHAFCSYQTRATIRCRNVLDNYLQVDLIFHPSIKPK